MAECWKYKFDQDDIEVKNNMAVAKLYINGELKDSKKGLFRAKMTSKLANGETVTVSLKAGFVPKCYLYVNGVLQTPVDAE